MSLNKTITIISGNYFPEDTAIGLYTSQFAKYLNNREYNVKVITGFPYYPQWKVWDDYEKKPPFCEETIDSITIFRYKQYVPKKVNFVGRVRLMISLLYGSIINSKKIKNSDLVICIVPSTLSIIPGIMIKKRTKSKLWIHIQDFEFDLAFESGILKSKNIFLRLIKKTLFWFESYLLNKADIVSSISNSMLRKINDKANSENLFYFPNWVSSTNIDPLTSKHHRYVSKEKFTLLYSGNVGEKQDWELFLKLCEKVNDSEIEIIIVGEGGYLNNLKEKSSKYSFVKFYPLVPYNELSDLLCTANAHFLFQKSNVLDTIMPSKILGMMASNKPSLVSGNKNSEVASIFNENNNVGYYFSDDNPVDIYNRILYLKNNPQLSEKIGENAREYILKNFAEENILQEFERKIQEEIK